MMADNTALRSYTRKNNKDAQHHNKRQFNVRRLDHRLIARPHATTSIEDELLLGKTMNQLNPRSKTSRESAVGKSVCTWWGKLLMLRAATALRARASVI